MLEAAPESPQFQPVPSRCEAVDTEILRIAGLRNAIEYQFIKLLAEFDELKKYHTTPRLNWHQDEYGMVSIQAKSWRRWWTRCARSSRKIMTPALKNLAKISELFPGKHFLAG